MLWGSGRILVRAVLVARTGVQRRVAPLLRTAGPTRRALALALTAALVASAGVVIHPFAHPAKVGLHSVRPSFDLAAGDDLMDGVGSATVSVSGLGRSHLSPGTAPAAKADERHALLIGINHAAGASPLEGAVTDALNVKQALLDYGFPSGNITTLLDAQASRSAILAALDDLVRATPPSGVAVVTIATHSRQHGGIDQLLTADGLRIDSTELAAHLQRLRARAWIALPTCFAGGYALPGVVGKNRIATFASSANAESYERGSAGSYLIIDMVREAMIERRAPYSVEAAFNWAQQTLERTNPNRVPTMSDGIPGDLVLGEMPGMQNTSTVAAAPPQRSSGTHYEARQSPDGPPAPSPQPPSSGGRRYSVGVCSNRATVNCGSP